MKLLADFKCPNGHTTEHYTESSILHVRCDCGEEARRIISGVNFRLPGHDTAYPTAHEKWVREHERAGSKKSP